MGYSVYEVNTDAVCAGPDAEKTAIDFLYDHEGNRKYLTRGERTAFLRAASTMTPDVRTFCLTLAYTGARISEVLALTPKRIDAETGVIVIESLKKRRRGIFRPVPVPEKLVKELESAHGVAAMRQDPERLTHRIWPWCRTTAWHRVKVCMEIGGIAGKQAMPKGLRHGFAVGTLQANVPITLVKDLLGHARLETTEVYAKAVGDEQRAIVNRFWATFLPEPSVKAEGRRAGRIS